MHSEQAQPWQLEANNKCEIAVADEYTGHKPKQLTQRQRYLSGTGLCARGHQVGNGRRGFTGVGAAFTIHSRKKKKNQMHT